MRTEWYENIFGDGYRDPSEDIQRLTVYILVSIVGSFGLVSFGYGLYEVFAQGVALPVIAALNIAGPALAYPCFNFLKAESRHWNFGYLDAESVITGGFMLGFAVLFLGVLGAELGAVAVMFLVICVGLGASILLLSLIGGLICAYWHKLPFSKNVMRDITIEDRYAMDDKMMVIPNHPSPHEEGLTACVRIRTAQGQHYELVCTREAYEAAKPGRKGHAKLINYRMLAFEHRS